MISKTFFRSLLLTANLILITQFLATAQTPVLVKDIAPASSNPTMVTRVGTTTFFVADDGTHGAELWKTKGTAATTALVKDINPGSGGAQIQHMVQVGSLLYFTAYSPTTGLEIWKTNGTPTGTVPVTEMGAGSSGGTFDKFCAVGSTLYFSALQGATGWELWKTTGSAATTTLVKDINPGGASSSPNYLTAHNSTLFFVANDGTHGSELWKSDGTAATTVLVKDIVPGVGTGSPVHLTSTGGNFFFRASNSTSGIALWQTDGTASGTTAVEVSPGITSITPDYFLAADGFLYFVGINPGLTARPIYRTDGTTTTVVYGIGISPTDLRFAAGQVFFIASVPNQGRELFVLDPTHPNGGRLVKDVNTQGQGATSQISQMTAVGGKLYFVATDGIAGLELWRSDGTTDGTVLVKDMVAGAGSPNIQNMVAVNNTLFFAATDPLVGREIFKVVEPATVQNLTTERAAAPAPVFSVQVFPVPADTNLSVVFPENFDGEALVELFNAAEHKVFSEKLDRAARIDFPTSDLPSGVYWLVVEAENEPRVVRKLVVQH